MNNVKEDISNLNYQFPLQHTLSAPLKASVLQGKDSIRFNVRSRKELWFVARNNLYDMHKLSTKEKILNFFCFGSIRRKKTVAMYEDAFIELNFALEKYNYYFQWLVVPYMQPYLPDSYQWTFSITHTPRLDKPEESKSMCVIRSSRHQEFKDKIYIVEMILEMFHWKTLRNLI